MDRAGGCQVAYGGPMRIFVAGATGVIGRRLVPLLLAQGHQVTTLSRHPQRPNPHPAARAQRTADAHTAPGPEAAQTAPGAPTVSGRTVVGGQTAADAHTTSRADTAPGGRAVPGGRTVPGVQAVVGGATVPGGPAEVGVQTVVGD